MKERKEDALPPKYSPVQSASRAALLPLGCSAEPTKKELKDEAPLEVVRHSIHMEEEECRRMSRKKRILMTGNRWTGGPCPLGHADRKKSDNV